MTGSTTRWGRSPAAARRPTVSMMSGVASSPGLDRAHGKVVEDGGHLGLDQRRREGVDLPDGDGALGGHRGDDRGSEDPECAHGLDVGLDPGPGPGVGSGDGHGHGRIVPAGHHSTIPSGSLEATAWNRRVMRPARRAARPDVTASRIAWAIRPGCRARVTAEATSTASQPSSMADAGVGGGADTGVQDHGHVGLLDDEGDVVGVADPEPAADRRPEGHDHGAPDLLEAPGRDRVVVAVGEHDEAVVDQLLRRGHQLHRVGQQGPVVADDLELDPLGLEGLPGQLGREHGLGGGVAARSVGQHPDVQLAEQVHQRVPGGGVDPPYGHRGHRRTRCHQGRPQGLRTGHAPGPENEPRGNGPPGDGQRRRRGRQPGRRPGCGSRRRGPGPGWSEGGWTGRPWVHGTAPTPRADAESTASRRRPR